jgi:hypothetical protein
LLLAGFLVFFASETPAAAGTGAKNHDFQNISIVSRKPLRI